MCPHLSGLSKLRARVVGFISPSFCLSFSHLVTLINIIVSKCSWGLLFFQLLISIIWGGKITQIFNDRFKQGDGKQRNISLRDTIEFLHLEQNGLLLLTQSKLFISFLKTLQSHHFIDYSQLQLKRHFSFVTISY